jgi:hypothetical protein
MVPLSLCLLDADPDINGIFLAMVFSKESQSFKLFTLTAMNFFIFLLD